MLEYQQNRKAVTIQHSIRISENGSCDFILLLWNPIYLVMFALVCKFFSTRHAFCSLVLYPWQAMHSEYVCVCIIDSPNEPFQLEKTSHFTDHIIHYRFYCHKERYTYTTTHTLHIWNWMWHQMLSIVIPFPFTMKCRHSSIVVIITSIKYLQRNVCYPHICMHWFYCVLGTTVDEVPEASQLGQCVLPYYFFSCDPSEKLPITWKSDIRISLWFDRKRTFRHIRFSVSVVLIKDKLFLWKLTEYHFDWR